MDAGLYAVLKVSGGRETQVVCHCARVVLSVRHVCGLYRKRLTGREKGNIIK